jgi:hypothetical protein
MKVFKCNAETPTRKRTELYTGEELLTSAPSGVYVYHKRSSSDAAFIVLDNKGTPNVSRRSTFYYIDGVISAGAPHATAKFKAMPQASVIFDIKE